MSDSAFWNKAICSIKHKEKVLVFDNWQEEEEEEESNT